ncbi:hypothetical protein DFQ27_005929 [Actinomortierella ambigua]|uniref:MPN domain-containing protein n=1 Tax=Actinomortierella ambigua TaxID=1343610 RepID=A0A9P6PZ79_9FUNG|nr:hypothetical protein DFQ27_005929 [Actinomortierella ambigua]
MHRTVASASRQQPRIERCLSRQELNDRAVVTLDEHTPIRYYIRSADLLFNQAKIYRLEEDNQTSYQLYMRYCNLVIGQLPKHPESKYPEHKSALIRLKNNGLLAMNEIERLRPILDRRYEEYKERLRQYREQQEAAERAASKRAQEEADEQAALKLARREEEYWASQMPQQEWSLAKALEGVPGVKASNSSSVHQHQHHAHQHPHQHHHHHHHSSLQTPLLPDVQYPQHMPHPLNAPAYAIPQPGVAKVAPPKALPPPLPKKPDIPKAAPAVSHRLLDEDIPAYEEGLRTLIVPIRLLDRFLNLVRPNTVKNLETCGILAGTLARNKFTVTTLIIPKQTATSDTCSTTNEDELFEFQMERDLMTLGWIHTHPTQTCFMSSVDLHTHCSYQLMLPEAIAIVCAPKHEKDYGVFRLTDPPGLQVITNCREKALFHQHPGQDNIYMDAADQGHVAFKDLELEIVDLRNK